MNVFWLIALRVMESRSMCRRFGRELVVIEMWLIFGGVVYMVGRFNNLEKLYKKEIKSRFS